jgi:hypothetical protein
LGCVEALLVYVGELLTYAEALLACFVWRAEGLAEPHDYLLQQQNLASEIPIVEWMLSIELLTVE